jgi:hypothetical protein
MTWISLCTAQVRGVVLHPSTKGFQGVKAADIGESLLPTEIDYTTLFGKLG